MRVKAPKRIVCVILEKKISLVRKVGIGFLRRGKTFTMAKNWIPNDMFIMTRKTPCKGGLFSNIFLIGWKSHLYKLNFSFEFFVNFKKFKYIRLYIMLFFFFAFVLLICSVRFIFVF